MSSKTATPTASAETCEKCGGSDLWSQYIAAAENTYAAHGPGSTLTGNVCQRTDEHLDRGCRTCQWRWISEIRARRNAPASATWAPSDVDVERMARAGYDAMQGMWKTSFGPGYVVARRVLAGLSPLNDPEWEPKFKAGVLAERDAILTERRTARPDTPSPAVDRLDGMSPACVVIARDEDGNVIARSPTPSAADAFAAHLALCETCDLDPFRYCEEGRRLKAARAAATAAPTAQNTDAHTPAICNATTIGDDGEEYRCTRFADHPDEHWMDVLLGGVICKWTDATTRVTPMAPLAQGTDGKPNPDPACAEGVRLAAAVTGEKPVRELCITCEGPIATQSESESPLTDRSLCYEPFGGEHAQLEPIDESPPAPANGVGDVGEVQRRIADLAASLLRDGHEAASCMLQMIGNRVERLAADLARVTGERDRLTRAFDEEKRQHRETLHDWQRERQAARAKGDRLPWNAPGLAEWAIVGMNHYCVEGERRLFVSMARDGRCIKAEGADEIAVFADLARTALAAARAERDAALAEAEQARRERDDLALRVPRQPFDVRCADALADEVAALVRRDVISSRSPAADALLDYRDPPSTPRADRLAELERDAADARAALDDLMGEVDKAIAIGNGAADALVDALVKELASVTTIRGALVIGARTVTSRLLELRAAHARRRTGTGNDGGSNAP